MFFLKRTGFVNEKRGGEGNGGGKEEVICSPDTPFDLLFFSLFLFYDTATFVHQNFFFLIQN